MLKEIVDTRQVTGDPFRRWFADNACDLIVWYGEEARISGFQLCYVEGAEKKALTWLEKSGFSHKTVDDGESGPARHKMTPILVPDGVPDKAYLAELVRAHGAELEPEIRDFVRAKLQEYAAGRGTHGRR